MRSFFAISLALVVGCGDNLSGPEPLPGDQVPGSGVADSDSAARLLPQICGVRTWPTAIIDSKDMDLRAVASPEGATILGVPKSGGILRGFQLDGRGLIIGDQAGVKVRTDGVYTGLSAGRIDGRLIVGLVKGDQVSVTAVRDDLGDYRELAVVDGAFVGDSTVMHSRNTKITMTGGPAGMVMSTFDNTWASMGSEVVARSVPTSMTSAAYGNDGMIGWSTETECHVQRVASDIHSMQPYPCKNARLAADYDARGGYLVYEAGEHIMLAKVVADGHNQLATEQQLAQFAHSPRIAFDGQRYWVSYLDFHGDLVVGFLDDADNLVSTAIEGTQPERDAYDLAVVAGVPWVYAADTNGVGATKMCVGYDN